ncbi:MAG: hypothetical protein FRX49_05221 [Trebouxia sp. A1-2]|nr:MAG: hypothetical protein FRX49_05221 [Trebouxia sp. A1-2]
MTLLDVLDIVPGLIKSLPREQWGQVMLTCSKCLKAVRHVVTEVESTKACIARDFGSHWGADGDAHVSAKLVQNHLPQLIKRKLTTVVLMGGSINLASIFKMIDAKWCGLTVLVLSNTRLGAECLHPLHQASWSELRWVDLSGNNWQPEESVAAAGLVQAKWPHLKGLNLRNCGLSDQAVLLLVGAYWPLLEFLDIGGGYYLASGLLHLVVALMDALLTHKWSLTSLELCSTELDAAVQKQLLEGTWPRA